jgi:hypothetical protein
MSRNGLKSVDENGLVLAELRDYNLEPIKPGEILGWMLRHNQQDNVKQLKGEPTAARARKVHRAIKQDRPLALA